MSCMIGGGTASLPPKPMLDLDLSVGKVWVAYRGGWLGLQSSI